MRFHKVDIILFVFVLLLLIQSLFVSIDPAFYSKIAILTSFYLIIRQFPVGFSVRLLYALPIFAIIQAICNYRNFTEPWQGLSHITGSFANSGIFGGFCALSFVATICLALIIEKRKFPRLFLVILTLLCCILLIYSRSRSAWLAAATACSSLYFIEHRILLKKFFECHKTIKCICLSIIISVTVICLYYFKKDSADGRILIWKISAGLIDEKPIFGFGSGGFRANYMWEQAEYFNSHPDSPQSYLADDVAVPFNEFLKIAIEQGFFGLILIFGILYFSFRTQYERCKEKKPIFAVFLTLTVFSCFSYTTEFLSFQIIAVYCIAALAKSKRQISGNRRTVNTKTWLSAYNLIIAIIFCISVKIYYSHYSLKIQFANSTIVVNSNNSLERMQVNYPKMKSEPMFGFTYGLLLLHLGENIEAIRVLKESLSVFPNSRTLLILGDAYEKSGMTEDAIHSYYTATLMKPALFEPHFKLAEIYRKSGDEKNARREFEIIENKKIKINNPKIEKMRRVQRE
jgi:O-antigen ligase